MLTCCHLDQMSRTEIAEIDKNTLVNINNIRVDTSIPASLRMEKYLEQIKNPYCFLCGSTPVQISFKEDGQELSDLLRSYFIGVKKSAPSPEL